MNLVATRWWSMSLLPLCLLMLGIDVGEMAAWAREHDNPPCTSGPTTVRDWSPIR